MEEQQNQTPQEQSPIEGKVFKQKESKIGPTIGAIIVIVIVVVGGLYFWNSQVEEMKEDIKQDQITNEIKEDPIEEADTIDRALDDLDLDAIDQELDAIDAEFESI
jgi:uncharacterized protein HemX